MANRSRASKRHVDLHYPLDWNIAAGINGVSRFRCCLFCERRRAGSRSSGSVQVSRTPAAQRYPHALKAGVGEAPRHEVAGGGAQVVQRALWGLSGGRRCGGAGSPAAGAG